MTTSLGCVPLVPNVISFYTSFPGDVKERLFGWDSTLCGFCTSWTLICEDDVNSVSHLHQLKRTDCYHPKVYDSFFFFLEMHKLLYF